MKRLERLVRLVRPVRLVHAAMVMALALIAAGDAGAFPFKALRARAAILDLDLDGAAEILEGAEDDPDAAIELGRLHLYRGDCDAALRVLERPDLDKHELHPMLLGVAKGCARATAATVIVRDDVRGVVVRFQDDEDRALFPVIADAAVKARDMLALELGTRLPDPLWIDLVRDQFTLAAHTGLPEEAAKTTGTVAVAKFGRVVMLSPRADPDGYPWMDTLAHELTHLVLSQATRDRAPLWLQEGVAKRQETRWRDPTPFDAIPSPDAVAWAGIQQGLALPLDGLGPSIAMLPSPEQARVAFAEVASFIQFWVDKSGREAQPKLLAALRDMPPGDDVSAAIKAVSGAGLAEWDQRWRGHLAATKPTLSPELSPGHQLPDGAKVARRYRLGELLLARGHSHAAEHRLAQAQALYAKDADLRCLYAEALRGQGNELAAAALVEQPAQIIAPSGRWWSLHDVYLIGDALPQARMHALGTSPFDPAVACHELPAGEYPADPIARAICEAAWRVPRE
jgi:hypothetical protein